MIWVGIRRSFSMLANKARCGGDETNVLNASWRSREAAAWGIQLA